MLEQIAVKYNVLEGYLMTEGYAHNIVSEE